MKNKLKVILLLFSQIVITSPTKITKEDLQKTIAAFHYSKTTIPSRIVAYQSPSLGKNSDDVADSQQSGDKKQINWDASKYHKFEVPFPNCAPERMSLFSPADMRSKHRCLHNNSDDRQYFYPSTQSNSAPYSSDSARQMLMEGARQASVNNSWYGDFHAGPDIIPYDRMLNTTLENRSVVSNQNLLDDTKND